MEKFLEKFQIEIEKKMLACIKGDNIMKPFSQIYSEVREKVKNKDINPVVHNPKTFIYSEGEASIYTGVVREFLKEHPELKEKKKEGEK